MFSVFSVVANATSQMFSVWFSNKKADQKLRGNFSGREDIGGAKPKNAKTAKYKKA